MSLDYDKVRRESMRWNIILALNNCRPMGSYEELVLTTMQSLYPDATQIEVRRELDYLQERDLLTVEAQGDGRWFGKLTRHGIDLAEYTTTCEPGIARPAKYWSSK